MKHKLKLKAYTLIELLVVLAIIGVLATVGIANMVRWNSETRISSANAQAKLMFDNAQTVVQQYHAAGRDLVVVGTDKIYALDNAFLYSNNGNLTVMRYVNTVSSGVTTTSIQHIVSDGGFFERQLVKDLTSYATEAGKRAWAIWIEDYVVREIVFSENPDGRYYGSYPHVLSLNEADGLKTTGGTSLNLSIIGANTQTIPLGSTGSNGTGKDLLKYWADNYSGVSFIAPPSAPPAVTEVTFTVPLIDSETVTTDPVTAPLSPEASESISKSEATSLSESKAKSESESKFQSSVSESISESLAAVKDKLGDVSDIIINADAISGSRTAGDNGDLIGTSSNSVVSYSDDWNVVSSHSYQGASGVLSWAGAEPGKTYHITLTNWDTNKVCNVTLIISSTAATSEVTTTTVAIDEDHHYIAYLNDERVTVDLTYGAKNEQGLIWSTPTSIWYEGSGSNVALRWSKYVNQGVSVAGRTYPINVMGHDGAVKFVIYLEIREGSNPETSSSSGGSGGGTVYTRTTITVANTANSVSSGLSDTEYIGGAGLPTGVTGRETFYLNLPEAGTYILDVMDSSGKKREIELIITGDGTAQGNATLTAGLTDGQVSLGGISIPNNAQFGLPNGIRYENGSFRWNVPNNEGVTAKTYTIPVTVNGETKFNIALTLTNTNVTLGALDKDNSLDYGGVIKLVVGISGLPSTAQPSDFTFRQNGNTLANNDGPFLQDGNTKLQMQVNTSVDSGAVEVFYKGTSIGSVTYGDIARDVKTINGTMDWAARKGVTDQYGRTPDYDQAIWSISTYLVDGFNNLSVSVADNYNLPTNAQLKIASGTNNDGSGWGQIQYEGSNQGNIQIPIELSQNGVVIAEGTLQVADYGNVNTQAPASSTAAPSGNYSDASVSGTFSNGSLSLSGVNMPSNVNLSNTAFTISGNTLTWQVPNYNGLSAGNTYSVDVLGSIPGGYGKLFTLTITLN